MSSFDFIQYRSNLLTSFLIYDAVDLLHLCDHSSYLKNLRKYISFVWLDLSLKDLTVTYIIMIFTKKKVE